MYAGLAPDLKWATRSVNAEGESLVRPLGLFVFLAFLFFHVCFFLYTCSLLSILVSTEKESQFTHI